MYPQYFPDLDKLVSRYIRENFIHSDYGSWAFEMADANKKNNGQIGKMESAAPGIRYESDTQKGNFEH